MNTFTFKILYPLFKNFSLNQKIFLLSVALFIFYPLASQARIVFEIKSLLTLADSSICDSIPLLTCVQSYVVILNNDGAKISASQLIASVSDNCTSESDLRNSATIISSTATTPDTTHSLILNCNDFILTGPEHVFNAKVWIKNAAGKINNCQVIIKFPYGIGLCGDPYVDFFGLSGGIIKTENSQAVSDVIVNAKINGVLAGSTITDYNGSFSINGLAIGEKYQYTASKPNLGNHVSDVTAYDIALVSQHILGIRLLNTPYKIISADVDSSGEIDATDLLYMRRYVLGITSSLPAGIWRFVNKAYVFKNPLNPLAEIFPEFVNVTINSSANINFVAIEVGDVNNSYELISNIPVPVEKIIKIDSDLSSKQKTPRLFNSSGSKIIPKKE